MIDEPSLDTSAPGEWGTDEAAATETIPSIERTGAEVPSAASSPRLALDFTAPAPLHTEAEPVSIFEDRPWLQAATQPAADPSQWMEAVDTDASSFVYRAPTPAWDGFRELDGMFQHYTPLSLSSGAPEPGSEEGLWSGFKPVAVGPAITSLPSARQSSEPAPSNGATTTAPGNFDFSSPPSAPALPAAQPPASSDDEWLSRSRWATTRLLLTDPNRWFTLQDPETQKTVASSLFGVPPQDLEKEMRRTADILAVADRADWPADFVADNWDFARQAYAEQRGDAWRDAPEDEDRFHALLVDEPEPPLPPPRVDKGYVLPDRTRVLPDGKIIHRIYAEMEDLQPLYESLGGNVDNFVQRYARVKSVREAYAAAHQKELDDVHAELKRLKKIPGSESQREALKSRRWDLNEMVPENYKKVDPNDLHFGQAVEQLEALGEVHPKRIQQRLRDLRAMDFERGKHDAAMLSNGAIVVRPALAFDKEAWAAAVNALNAPAWAKAQAMQDRIVLRDSLGDDLYAALWGSQKFRDWVSGSAPQTIRMATGIPGGGAGPVTEYTIPGQPGQPDLGNVSYGALVERFRAQLTPGEKRAMQIGSGAAAGFHGIGKSFWGFTSWLGLGGEEFANISDEEARKAARVAEGLGGATWLHKLSAGVVGLAPTVATGGVGRWVGQGLGLGEAATGRLAFRANVGAGGVQAIGSSYPDALKTHSPAEARGLAVLNAAPEVALAYAFGPSGREAMGTRVVAPRTVSGTLKAGVKGAANDLAQGVATTIAQTPAQSFINPDDHLADRMHDTLVVTPILGGTLHALQAWSHALQQQARQRQQPQNPPPPTPGTPPAPARPGPPGAPPAPAPTRGTPGAPPAPSSTPVPMPPPSRASVGPIETGDGIPPLLGIRDPLADQPTTPPGLIRIPEEPEPTPQQAEAARAGLMDQAQIDAEMARQRAAQGVSAKEGADPVSGALKASPKKRDPMTEQHFNGKGTVEMEDRSPISDADKARFIALSGAPDGATIRVKTSPAGSSIADADVVSLKIDHPLYQETSHRALLMQRGILHNAFIKLRPEAQRKGYGARMFATQVKAAIGHFDEIHALGAGFPGDENYNGFLTWPRFGFNAPLSEPHLQDLPRSLRGAKTILDLMETKAGREFWEKNGSEYHLIFDLRPGSRSRRVLAEYLKEKHIEL